VSQIFWPPCSYHNKQLVPQDLWVGLHITSQVSGYRHLVLSYCTFYWIHYVILTFDLLTLESCHVMQLVVRTCDKFEVDTTYHSRVRTITIFQW